MPTLDDIIILAPATPSGDDLFAVYDNQASGPPGSRIRKVALNQLVGLSPTDVVTAAPASATITVSSRVTQFYGLTTGNNVAVTLPSPSGALHECILINGNDTGSTMSVITPVASTLFTFASASGVTYVTGYSPKNIVRFMSDGTNWYRVH